VPQMILLIEDNQTDIGLTRRALVKSGIGDNLVVKEDGQDALDFLFNKGISAGGLENILPDLILLDLKMPKVSGLEVLRRIREDRRTRRIPVVVLTSSIEEKDVAAAYDLGANSYLRKPVDFKQFAEAIHSIGSYWLELNVPPPLTQKT